MKTIRIKIVNFWDSFNCESFSLFKILRDHYNVEFCDENPDYIFCSCFDCGKGPYEYLEYPQIRIMFDGENHIPDFNFIDYAICMYPITFMDRCFYLPTGDIDAAQSLENMNRNYTRELLAEKRYFANFIFSHESEDGLRGAFFKQLSNYKRIEAAGTYLNNMNDGYVAKRRDESKLRFQRKSKFTLCFESTKNEGFVTEKIVDAFLADTIPIYYGSSTVNDIFNPGAFINIANYDCFDDAIEIIKELDNDDEKYLSMLRQSILNDSHFFSKTRASLDKFILNIFEQPIESAYRRSRVYSAKSHEDYILSLRKIKKEYGTSIMKKNIRKIINTFHGYECK